MTTRSQVEVPRPIRRHRRSHLVSRLVSFLGCAVALQPSLAAAQVRPVPPAGTALDSAPPWSEPGGYPPPPPLGRTRTATSPRHPAIHPRPEARVAPLTPLFPRAADEAERKAARRAAMERHPAGKGLDRPRVPGPSEEPRLERSSPPPAARPASPDQTGKTPGDRKHRVRPGETLWGIAARRCGSERPIDILRLTMEIHRLNRQVIGADPDLILPGQLLSLPKSSSR